MMKCFFNGHHWHKDETVKKDNSCWQDKSLYRWHCCECGKSIIAQSGGYCG